MRIVHTASPTLPSSAPRRRRACGGHRRRARRPRFDPEVAARLVDDSAAILAFDGGGSAWDEALAMEPSPPLVLEGAALDRGLAAMGRFADLMSPYFTGHSVGVAELASEAAGRCRIDAAGATAIRAPASSTTSEGSRSTRGSGRSRAPDADELEQVRLHPYHTERCSRPSRSWRHSPRLLLPTTSGSTEAATTAAALVPT